MGRRKTYGFSFSWKRALGISSFKQKIARATGIPTTRQGRQRKIGSMITGTGCMIQVLIFLALTTFLIIFTSKFIYCSSIRI